MGDDVFAYCAMPATIVITISSAKPDSALVTLTPPNCDAAGSSTSSDTSSLSSSPLLPPSSPESLPLFDPTSAMQSAQLSNSVARGLSAIHFLSGYAPLFAEEHDDDDNPFSMHNMWMTSPDSMQNRCMCGVTFVAVVLLISGVVTTSTCFSEVERCSGSAHSVLAILLLSLSIPFSLVACRIWNAYNNNNNNYSTTTIDNYNDDHDSYDGNSASDRNNADDSTSTRANDIDYANNTSEHGIHFTVDVQGEFTDISNNNNNSGNFDSVSSENTNALSSSSSSSSSTSTLTATSLLSTLP